jgi:hypothetical protein
MDGEGPLVVKNTGKVPGDDGEFAMNYGPLIVDAPGASRIGTCIRSIVLMELATEL